MFCYSGNQRLCGSGNYVFYYPWFLVYMDGGLGFRKPLEVTGVYLWSPLDALKGLKQWISVFVIFGIYRGGVSVIDPLWI